MARGEEQVGIAPEGVLRAVAVVDVEVCDRDPRQPPLALRVPRPRGFFGLVREPPDAGGVSESGVGPPGSVGFAEEDIEESSGAEIASLARTGLCPFR